MDEREHAIDLIREVNRFARAGDIGDALVGEMTIAQLRVLFRLRSRGPMTSGHLAAALGVTLPTVTSVIDRLVRHGLVERRDDPADRRRVIVALAPEGQATLERIQEGRRARLARAIETMDPDAREKLVAGLRALVEAATQVDLAEVAGDIGSGQAR